VGLKYERLLDALTVAALLGVHGCGEQPGNAPAATSDTTAQDVVAVAEPRFTRGIVLLGTPARITRCGATDTIEFLDPGARLEAARGQLGAGAKASNELFIIAAARREKAGELTVDEVLYASPEKFDCFTDWQSFDYRATGNNPGWVAEVRGSHVKLERQGAAPAEWNNATRDSTDNRIRVTASNGNSFELLLERHSCANTVSGAYSAWSAQVTTAGVVLKGCSVTGG
jgi:uncharacterized membrane protein